jgi:signal recognition particle GTPase
MTVQEIENPDGLTGLMKERIYKASGMGPTEVSRLLYVYKQSLVVHTWLQEK